ncbi:alpha-amylase family glycosyl hydrolase [bacterium]|nr:alpha-amylase family glycosyl hydrolase [bacterium]
MSFKDSNGDGYGDLKGLTSKLDYLKDLGVDYIYLNPVTAAESKTKNFSRYNLGYHALELNKINPRYGTMADFENLIKQAKKKNIKIILDFVEIALSKHHPFFIDAISNPNSPYKDWFLFKNEKPKEAWVNYLGGGWHKLSNGKYYFALYGQAPFPHYSNPEVQSYFLGLINFWMSKGIEGFRLDALKHLFIHGPKQYEHQPELFEYIKKIKAIVRKYGKNKILIGEVIPYPINHNYIGYQNEMLDLIYDGVFTETQFSGTKINLKTISSKYLNSFTYEGKKPHQLTFFANHDRGRIGHKFNQHALSYEDKIKLMASLHLLDLGTPLIYYGEELGLLGYLDSGNKKSMQTTDALTTMPWSKKKYGGFSTTEDKIFPPLSKDYPIRNVELQTENPKSVLNHYKKLIKVRKSLGIFSSGSRKKLKQLNPNIYHSFFYDNENLVWVVHNLSSELENLSYDFSPYLRSIPALTNVWCSADAPVVDQVNYKATLKKVSPYGSCVYKLEGITAKDIINVTLAKAYIQSEARQGNKNYILLNKSADEALRIYKKNPGKVDVTYFKDPGLFFANYQIVYKNSFELSGEKFLPIPDNISAIKIIGQDEVGFSKSDNLKSLFKKKATQKYLNTNISNIKSIDYGKDQHFLYFKIKQEKMTLQKNGGLDYCFMFDDLEQTTGANSIEFWLLNKIFTPINTIETLMIYQHDHREKHPIVFSDVNANNQPGVKNNHSVLFFQRDDYFYLMIDRKVIPYEKIQFAIITWSAGTAWGGSEKTPPIVDQLPYDISVMRSKEPNVIQSFLKINQ